MVDVIIGNPSDYKVGVPAVTGFNQDCVEFPLVWHVTHGFRTPEILRAGEVNGRLVYDNSTLNKSRIHVVWVSPNHWFNGYRYGNISLCFEWQKLVSTRKPFWVEVAQYKVPACRILLSDQPHPNLTPYDPTNKQGPWWWDKASGRHYFNSYVCLEFMVEGDLDLKEVVSTAFVDHHADYCSEYRDAPKSCSDLASPKADGGARFMARVVGAGSIPKPLRVEPKHLESGWKRLRADLSPTASAGYVKSTDPLADSICTSALWLYASGQDADAKLLLSVFPAPADALDVLRRRLEGAFGLPQGTLP